MCDYLSLIGRQLGQLPETYHDSTNSHSGMIETVGWKANQPISKILVFEFECKEPDLMGDADIYANASKFIRNFCDCPDSLVKKLCNEATKVRNFVKHQKGIEFFADLEKWSDVWCRLKKLPYGFKFPEKHAGDLDLRSGAIRFSEAKKLVNNI